MSSVQDLINDYKSRMGITEIDLTPQTIDVDEDTMVIDIKEV